MPSRTAPARLSLLVLLGLALGAGSTAASSCGPSTRPLDAPVALVLSGGGAKGAYEAGVAAVFVERGLPIRLVSGSLPGALHAALVADAPMARHGTGRGAGGGGDELGAGRARHASHHDAARAGRGIRDGDDPPDPAGRGAGPAEVSGGGGAPAAAVGGPRAAAARLRSGGYRACPRAGPGGRARLSQRLGDALSWSGPLSRTRKCTRPVRPWQAPDRAAQRIPLSPPAAAGV